MQYVAVARGNPQLVYTVQSVNAIWSCFVFSRRLDNRVFNGDFLENRMLEIPENGV